MSDFKIIRSVNCNFLFNLISDNKVILENVSFEVIQNRLGIISEDYSKHDDGRYMLMI